MSVENQLPSPAKHSKKETASRRSTTVASAVAAALLLSACAEQTTDSHTKTPIPGLSPTSHSLCIPSGNDTTSIDFASGIAKLAGEGNLCNDSDASDPAIVGQSSYDSTDGSGRFVRISRIKNPGEFEHDQQLAQQGGFTQTQVNGHPAIYHQGELTVRLDADVVLDITAGTYGSEATHQTQTTAENEATIEQIASDILPSFS